jgi:hypothetical protein
MFKMLDKLKNSEAADRRERITRYAELLMIGDAVTADQIAELKTLMDKLGFDSKRAEADARALAERKRLSILVAAVPAREAAQIDHARQHAALAASTEKSIRALSDALARSLSELHRLERDHFGARRAEPMLDELDRINWEIFGLEEPSKGPTGPIPFNPMLGTGEPSDEREPRIKFQPLPTPRNKD